MISSVCWVPRGASRFVPDFSEPTDEELERYKAEAELRVSSFSELEKETARHGADEIDSEEDDVDEDIEGFDEETQEIIDSAVEKANAIAEAMQRGSRDDEIDDKLAADLAELDMEHYDDEEDGEIRLFGNGGLGAAYYKNNDEDPYIVLKDEEDEEEIEDLTIKETDLLILTARNEDDVSHLEVWICEEDTADASEELNMYVHHDIILPAFPLSLAWLDFGLNENGKGNLVAVGTMQPEIEIWDLDKLDTVEPSIVLGGTILESDETLSSGNKSKKKKKKSKPKFKEGSHLDSVLSLSWNKEFRNVLSSGSADKTVKVWDIATQTCQHTMTHHTDKVQNVAWNPKEPLVLLSGSFDKTVALCDMRHPTQEAVKWFVSSDVECLSWNIHDPFYFLVSTEDGLVRCFDVRKGGVKAEKGSNEHIARNKNDKSSSSSTSQSIFTLQAHDKATCAISFSSIPNLIASASTDKMVKLWDISNNAPVCISSQNPKLGAIFSLAFSEDSPNLLAMGGSKGKLHVWDVSTDASVVQRFNIRS